MPKDPTQVYLRAVQAARNKVIGSDGIPKKSVNDLRRVYAQMLQDINRDLSSAAISAERADALKRQIVDSFNRLGKQMNLLFDNSRLSAAQTIANGHIQGVQAASEAAGVSLSVDFNAVPQQALRLMMAKRGLQAKNYKTVINRGLQAAADEIDDFLASAISRGVSTRRAGQELAGILSRSDEAILNLVNDRRLTRSAIQGALKTGGITPQQYKQAYKVLYDSQRIIQTETMEAFRSSDVISQTKSPVVRASRWEISGNHHITDSCDYLAEADQFDLGPGVFPSQNVPSAQHPHCLPGDSLVMPRGKVESVSKRWFDGNVIVIHTARGNKLTCTPNHPVLCGRGFVGADTLNVGDKVINNAISEGKSVVEGNNINKPTPIKEIVESFLDNSAVLSVPVPPTTKDFNSDRANSKIGVIGTNSLLGNRAKTLINKSLINNNFIFRNIRAFKSFFLDSLSSLNLFLNRNFSATACFMWRIKMYMVLTFGQVFPINLPSFGMTPNCNSIFIKPFTNGASIYSKFFRESNLGFSFIVELYYFINRKFFSNSSYFDISFLKSSRYYWRTNIKKIGNLFNRFAGFIKGNDPVDRNFNSFSQNDEFLAQQILNGKKEPIVFDEIVKIEVKEYHDFVYNIKTSESYYFANSIATHNCSCYLTSVLRKPSEWSQPKQTLIKPTTVKKEDLQQLMSGQTENAIQTQVETINKYQQLAYQVAKKAGAA